MSECQECGQPFEQTKWWRLFCSIECRQVWHRRKYRAEAVEDELNGRDRGTKAEREAAKQAIAAFTESLRRPDVEVAESAQVLRRRF
jgi:hypothetical protein